MEQHKLDEENREKRKIKFFKGMAKKIMEDSNYKGIITFHVIFIKRFYIIGLENIIWI